MIREVARKLDKQLDFNKIIGGVLGYIVEYMDGKIIEGALVYGYSKIPEDYKEDVDKLFEAYLQEDYSNLPNQVADRINKLIDVPKLDEKEEEIILQAIANAVFKILLPKK